MSCSTPNLQNIPRDEAYRACFQPSEGRVLVKADLSLVELCVAAELADDERMLQALADGHDLHRLTAAALFAKDPPAVTAAERAFGKAVNFGTLYGQGKRGLMELARQHGLMLSEVEAGRFQRRFADAWPALTTWQRRQMIGRSTTVRTAAGRLRRVQPNESGPIRANTPVQGTAADGFKAALARLWETRGAHPSAVPILAVHDELVVECDAADAVAVASWVTECLQAGMGRYLSRVVVQVEATIAETWAGMAEESGEGPSPLRNRTLNRSGT
jgi:DNA polymerase-1